MLTEEDMKKLLESYLLEDHSEALSLDVVEQCFGVKVLDIDKDISFGVLADKVRVARADIDTHFIDHLNDGQYNKVLSPTASIYHQSQSVSFLRATDYASYKHKSPALCHTVVRKNEVGYIQWVDNDLYYMLVSIDKSYTLKEAANGYSSIISHITTSSYIDDNYLDIPSVKTCVDRFKSNVVFNTNKPPII